MKKRFAIVLAACLCLALTACNGSKDDEIKTASEPTPEATSEPAPEATPEPTQEPTPEPTEKAETLLSEPYAQMLKSGDYQYTYSLTYEGKAYQATIAAKDGMFSRRVTSDDGAFNTRVLTIEGNAWEIDDLTGAASKKNAAIAVAEVQPDYSASLTFAGVKTLDTGYIAEAYDFTYQGAKCNIVFVLSPEGELVMLVPTIGENTAQMEIVEMKAPADASLFKAPEVSEMVCKQNEVFTIDSLFTVTVGEAYTYDNDLFLDEAGSGLQWLGVPVYLKNISGETLSPFLDYITGTSLIRGADSYAAIFSEANPSGSDYAETLKDIAPDTEIEAFMKFRIPADLAISDGFTLRFTVDGILYSCDIK